MFKNRWAPGCNCCGGVESPCCDGTVPTTLHLSDGIGTIDLTYEGPTPISLLSNPAWWGCATRSVTGGRAYNDVDGCGAEPVDFSTEIVFALECRPEEGYILWVFFFNCVFDDVAYLRDSPGCGTPWDASHQSVFINFPNELPALSCDPFSWEYQSLDFGVTGGFQGLGALDEIYDDPPLWTISE